MAGETNNKWSHTTSLIDVEYNFCVRDEYRYYRSEVTKIGEWQYCHVNYTLAGMDLNPTVSIWSKALAQSGWRCSTESKWQV
jgi:hypothetical protein